VVCDRFAFFPELVNSLGALTPPPSPHFVVFIFCASLKHAFHTVSASSTLVFDPRLHFHPCLFPLQLVSAFIYKPPARFPAHPPVPPRVCDPRSAMSWSPGHHSALVHQVASAIFYGLSPRSSVPATSPAPLPPFSSPGYSCLPTPGGVVHAESAVSDHDIP